MTSVLPDEGEHMTTGLAAGGDLDSGDSVGAWQCWWTRRGWLGRPGALADDGAMSRGAGYLRTVVNVVRLF